jgi:PIN domain nuclease of toxin-antitoxin system
VIVLLDTHALLWALAASSRLSATAREVIEDNGNVFLVSVVCAWEIEIKKSLGRLEAPDDLEDAIEEAAPLVSADPLISQYPIQVIW